MSFDKLNIVSRKQEIVDIETSDGVLRFYANELSYTQRVSLSALSHSGEDVFTKWLAMSITDQDGGRMSLEQAHNLPDDIAEKMFKAVMRVNEQEKKDIKKKSKRK